MPYRPEMRQDELTVREVGQELIVYDARHRRAHRLNKAAAPILQASDGTRTIDEIASILPYDLGAEERSELVQLTLQDLSEADLLAAPFASPRNLDRSRRDLLQKAAVVGLLPVVESIAAPPAHAHASGHAAGGRRGGSDHRRGSDWAHHKRVDLDRHRDRQGDR
jgi:hypothetical protein